MINYIKENAGMFKNLYYNYRTKQILEMQDQEDVPDNNNRVDSEIPEESPQDQLFEYDSFVD